MPAKNEDYSEQTAVDMHGEKSRKYDISYTQNREISWLEFNRRVLEESMDERVPILERYKFLSIFTSNLDEFMRVRVGSLLNLRDVNAKAADNKTTWTSQEQLDHIFAMLPRLYKERDAAFAAITPLLEQQGIRHLTRKDLSKKDAAFVEEYYQQNLFPILSPLIIDARHPFPHLTNEMLYLFCDVKDRKGQAFYGLIGIPNMLPPILFFPGRSDFILLEDIVRSHLTDLLRDFKIENTAIVSITRNADIDLDEGIDELNANLRQAMKKALRMRNRLAPVRLEIQGSLGKSSIKFLQKYHGLSSNQVCFSAAPLRMKYVFSIEDHLTPKTRDQVCYRPFTPQLSPMFHPARPVLDQVLESDKLLHYPYESMDPFLRMLKEAANDPSVISISITIYRMASVSKVAEYLAQAAENGKDVLALMELRARFDEENNIDYSERLEQAGCTVIYGLEDYKVHSKICHITLYRDARIQTVTQIGTGNYNEKTARQYTDLSYFTADERVGNDASAFFKNMLISKLDGAYKRLLVAPNGIKPTLMSLFDREILRAHNGEPARVILKCNSVTERDLLDKIAEASQAGVEVTMIVRGICCILPGIPGKTDNLRVISVVGRFLEHHRIYCFGAHGEDMYLSSADLMTRNLVNRVEIAVPIRDEAIREQLLHILEVFLLDNEKAKELQPDGSYLRVHGTSGISAQSRFMEEAEDAAGRFREKLHAEAEKSRRRDDAAYSRRQLLLEQLEEEDREKLEKIEAEVAGAATPSETQTPMAPQRPASTEPASEPPVPSAVPASEASASAQDPERPAEEKPAAGPSPETAPTNATPYEQAPYKQVPQPKSWLEKILDFFR